MKHFLSIVCFIFAKNICFSQHFIDYHNKCNFAAESIDRGDFVTAQAFLADAFSCVPEPLPVDCFQMAKCYSQLGNADSTLHYINLAMEKPRLKKIIRIHFLWFEPILGTEKWEEIVAKTREETNYEPNEFVQRMNPTMDYLNALFTQHQKVFYDSIRIYYPHDSLLTEKYLDSMQMAQARGLMVFDSIVQSLGQIPYAPEYEYVLSNAFYFMDSNYFMKNEAFFIQELDAGRILPSWFITPQIKFKSKIKGLGRLIVRSEYLTPEQLELCAKYGYSFNYHINNLREYGFWTYEDF